MANYKNTYAKRKKNGTAANIGKGIAIVLVTFLAIGLLGSLFSRPSDSADVDKKDPTTATNPTEAPKTITFSIMGDTFEALEGMTFAEWLATDPEFPDEEWYLLDDGVVDSVRGYGGLWLYEGNDPVGDVVLGTTVIQDGGEYNPT